jgi:hypothetical protein
MKVYLSPDEGVRYSQFSPYELLEIAVRKWKMEFCLSDGAFFNLVGRVIINGLVGIEWNDEAFRGILAEADETLSESTLPNI